jgi:hypothetical protein
VQANHLKHLGYIISKKKLRIPNTSYEVREILDEDNNRPVSFSFLMSRKQCMGIILPKEYHRYVIIANEDEEADNEKKNCKSKNSGRGKKPTDL